MFLPSWLLISREKLILGLRRFFGLYQSVLCQLADLDKDVVRGAQVCSRVRRVKEVESSSAFFFCLEKKRGSNRWISAQRNVDGTIVSSPSDLCASFTSFYFSFFC